MKTKKLKFEAWQMKPEWSKKMNELFYEYFLARCNKDKNLAINSMQAHMKNAGILIGMDEKKNKIFNEIAGDMTNWGVFLMQNDITMKLKEEEKQNQKGSYLG